MGIIKELFPKGLVKMGSVNKWKKSEKICINCKFRDIDCYDKFGYFCNVGYCEHFKRKIVVLKDMKPEKLFIIERRDNMEEDKNKRGTEYKTGEIDGEDFSPLTSYSKCQRCHRQLKTKKAMRLGYGHICLKKIKDAAYVKLNEQVHEQK